MISRISPRPNVRPVDLAHPSVMLRYAELVGGVAERMLQELIEAEATARVGAEWNEHAETRTVLRRRPRYPTPPTPPPDDRLHHEKGHEP